MVNVLSTFCFAAFVACGAVVVLAKRRFLGEAKACVSAFVLSSLLVSCGAALSKRDLWPFSRWSMAGIHPQTVQDIRLVAVDSAGIEHEIDYRAWHPLPFDELIAWLVQEFPRLDSTAQDRVGRYLLNQVNEARARAESGRTLGSGRRILGPVGAPYFLLHPVLWSRTGQVPPQPFVRLRIYRDTWSLEERKRDPRKITRALAYEYRQP